MNRELLKLAIPNILTNLSIPLVSMVDLGLMGRMPSTAYILAIGFGTVIFNFVYWAFGFLRMGTTGMVSQAFGKNDQAEIKELLRKGLIISFSGGLLLLLLQWPLKELALIVINPDKEVIGPLLQYFDIRIYAAPATISIYVFTGWLLGMQDAKSALILAIVVNGINATLSYLLVVYTSLSIEGVALGTVVAQYCGLAIAILLLLKKHRLSLKAVFSNSKSQKSAWKDFVLINSDIFIRTLCLIFVMSFFKTKAGNIDPILGAANILLLEFITISAYGIDGFAFAAESICGKYFGRADQAAFKRSVNLSMIWGIGIAALLSLCYWLFGKEILFLLTDKDKLVDAALIYLPWLIAAPVVNAFAFIWDGIYVGTTSSKAMRNTMLLSTFVVFLPIFFIAKANLQNHGMWLAFTLFMLSRGVFQSFLAKRYVFSRLRPTSE
ncbi:MAG: MATE family efflux transporter [Vicingaceae bacterium]